MASSSRENPYRALEPHAIKKIKRTAKEISARSELCSRREKILSIIQKVNDGVQFIKACDLPLEKEEKMSDIEATRDLIGIIQQSRSILLNIKDEVRKLDRATIDRIKTNLSSSGFDLENASLLQRIEKITALSKTLAAGNCMEKAVVAFCDIQKEFLDTKLSTEERAISLELGYLANHYLVIVDDFFVLDPWLNINFPLVNGRQTLHAVFEYMGTYNTFFRINADWQCDDDRSAEGTLVKDSISTFYLKNKNSPFFTLREESKEESESKAVVSHRVPPPPGYLAFITTPSSSIPPPPPGYLDFMTATSKPSSSAGKATTEHRSVRPTPYGSRNSQQLARRSRLLPPPAQREQERDEETLRTNTAATPTSHT